MYISIASLLPVNQSRISLQYHEPMTLLDLYRSWITSADAINLFNAQEKSRKISKSYEMYFFMYLLYKINRFHFSVVCSVIDVQRTSQRDKNISDSLNSVSWATFLFLPRCNVIFGSEKTFRGWTIGKLKCRIFAWLTRRAPCWCTTLVHQHGG